MDRLNRKAAKRRLDSLRRAVADAINTADPVSLLEDGAPRDEYEPEVGTILPRLADAQSAGDVRRILHEEFIRWFGEDLAGPDTAYDTPAQEIWNTLGSWRAV